jgi:hypothetical protein
MTQHVHVLNLVSTRSTKGVKKKLGMLGFANSTRVRRGIYSRDTVIRICSVSQLISKNKFVKIPS